MILKNFDSRKLAQYGTLLLGIIFIAYGAYRGEANTVLSKAIRLCMECVGIG